MKKLTIVLGLILIFFVLALPCCSGPRATAPEGTDLVVGRRAVITSFDVTVRLVERFGDEHGIVRWRVRIEPDATCLSDWLAGLHGLKAGQELTIGEAGLAPLAN